MGKNLLGIEITRTHQVLILMRGISGSGKSTLATSLVENGVIHSTDVLVESTGDYRGFFSKMMESGDWSELSRMHSKNLSNAIKSMADGITPVIIDNTNLKANEPKAYVVAALEMGFDENNIQIHDVGTRNLSAEQLAESNTHGVPLDKIKMMMQSYKSTGPLTVKKIIESKDIYKQSNVIYSCVLLYDESKARLLEKLGDKIPKDWVVFANHMTICLGEMKDKTELGKIHSLHVTHIGISDMALAVKVEGFKTNNAIPHITIAINPEGGKAKMSNEITKWQGIKNFSLMGIVTEITNENKL